MGHGAFQDGTRGVAAWARKRPSLLFLFAAHTIEELGSDVPRSYLYLIVKIITGQEIF
jgi:hypothetical protein